MEKISIIVPIYNTESYLPECLDSILSQTYQNFEAILVDDGSTDSSKEIAKKYAEQDSRFIFLTQKNQGLFSARNTGIAKASGDWILFLDSDDLLSASCLKKLLNNVITSHGKIAVSGYKPFIGRNKPKVSSKKEYNISILNQKEATQIALYQKEIPDYSAWNKLYSANIWKKNSFKPYKFAEDLATIPEILLKSERIVVTEEPLYFYRKRKGSLLNSSYDMDKAKILEIAESVHEYIKNNEPSIIRAAENTLFSAACSVLWKTQNTSEFSEIRNRAYGYIKKYRFKILFDTRTRLRNKYASILSLFGKWFLIFAMRRFG